ncbi:MAG: c-type cytochrome [Gammaproteobacteria bacterium]|jgi:mono/diheme cytochrome c family protein
MRPYIILIATVVFVATLGTVQAQSYGLGTIPTETELAALDTLVDNQGRLLPNGQGSAIEGAPMYAQRCAMCHGANGEGTQTPAGSAPQLIASSPDASEAIRSGKYYFSTTLWSFIYRAMPLHQERTLTVDQAYALTAYLLYRNNIIDENEVMNQRTLPEVTMPGHEKWKLPSGDSS